MKKFAAVWLVLLTCACGSSDNTNANPGNGNSTGGGNTTVAASTKITVSGFMVPFPSLTTLDSNDYSHAMIALADPQTVIANPTASPNFLGTAMIDLGTCSQTEGCPFTISNVDTANLQVGMTMGVIDTRTSTDLNAVSLYPLFTGVSQAQISAAQSTGKLQGLYAFGMRVDGYAKLAAAVGSTSLTTNGFLVGYVLDSTNHPVSGATLTSAGYTGHIWYPAVDANSIVTASGTTTAGPTGPSGLIVVSPSTPAVSLNSNWSLTATGGAKYTVPAPLGTTPGYGLVVGFVPNP